MTHLSYVVDIKTKEEVHSLKDIEGFEGNASTEEKEETPGVKDAQ